MCLLALIATVTPASAAQPPAAEAAALAARGGREIAAGNPAAALKALVRAHALAPGNREYVHNAASIAASLGDSATAVAMFKDAAKLAAQAGNRDDVAVYDGEITKLRAALPAWVAERTQAASAVPEAKQRVVALWGKVHQQAVAAANAGDVAQALARGEQALTVARDNLGDSHIASIISAGDLATAQAMAGQVEAAEANLRAATEAARAMLGDGHPETLKVQGGLVDLYRAQANYAAAAEAAEVLALAAAKALGIEHPVTLAAQLAVARNLADSGRDAEALVGKVCAASRRVFGDVHAETARCLAQWAGLKRQRGDYAAAGPAFAEAMAVQRLTLAPADPQALTTRIGFAELALRQGRLGDAQDVLEGVAADAAQAGDQGNLLAAKADLADVLAERGDTIGAEALVVQVLEQQTATLGAAHPSTVASLTSLAVLYRAEGRLADAEAAFGEAYARFTKILGADHRSTLVAANNLGEILEQEGVYDRAEPYLRAALDGTRRAAGDTHPATLTAMNNLALLYESQGVFDKAEPLYHAVIAATATPQGPRPPEATAALNNLAYLYLLKGEHDKALPLFRQVYESWLASHGPKHQNTLKALNNLARAEMRLGDFAAAEPHFDQALAARRAALGERHPDTLRSMHDLADLYRVTGRPEQALGLAERTLAADEAVLGPNHPYTFETRETLAAVQDQRGDGAAAFATRRGTFLRRTAFLDRMLPVTGDNAREGYIRLHAPELSAYVALLRRQDPAVAGQSLLEVSLARKGILLKVASEIAQVTRLSRDPGLAATTQELTALRKRLAALTLSGPTAETKDHHLDVVAGLEDRVNAVQGELGRASARLRQTTQAVGVADAVAALPDDAALVDFVIYGEDGQQKLLAATVRKDSGVAVFGLVAYDDLAAIDAAVVKYRADIQNEDIALDDLLESGQAVTRLVWQPLAVALAGRATVYVVPDGALNILPIAALVDDAGKYLIEGTDLHVLNSARDLAPSAVAPATGGYLIDAGPDYNTDQAVGKDQLDRAKSRSAADVQAGVRGMASGLRGLRFDPLPGAEREGQLINKTVTGAGQPSVIHTKGEAQEKSLRDLDAPPEILHIATHGFFLKPDDSLRKRLLKLQRSGDFQAPPPGDNPLLRAGLAFAGVNANAPVLGDIDTDNDGVLTALEVLGLNLTGTRLAILSACETGLGEIHEGEGVYGLRRAFQEAGARAVISSLWEVSDAGTQTLMAALYKRLLAGQPPHQALREAQLEMLRNGQWSMPYVWSAFFMVGG